MNVGNGRGRKPEELEFEVEDPKKIKPPSKKIRQAEDLVEELVEELAEELTEELTEWPSGEKTRVAAFVTHGMGQQVPFETLDQVTQGLIQAANRKGESTVSKVRVRAVRIGDIKTQRTEFDIPGKNVEVHLYEAYWAPLTQGRVTLSDVMSFLWSAGWSGLLNSFSKFKRWMFGKYIVFGKQKWASIKLLFAIAVLLSLVVLNTLIATVTAGHFLIKSPPTVFSDSTFNALTSIAGVVVVVTISMILLFEIPVFVYKKRRRKSRVDNRDRDSRYTGKFLTRLIWYVLYVWIGLIIASAVVMLIVVSPWCNKLEGWVTCPFLKDYWQLIWGLLLVASWYIRRIFVQYPGDVAAYVSSNTLDRFDALRKQIKSTVFDLAKAVYSIRQYERIALLGHSLGSVVIYDTLNALLKDDDFNGGSLGVLDRTCLLMTFGSPLDKTAFIFANQSSNTSDTREALAATKQPLIVKYDPYRKIKWINVFSRNDIVSNWLHFYDDDENENYEEHKVDNVEDARAWVPIYAHVQYWKNPTVFDRLYERLVAG